MKYNLFEMMSAEDLEMNNKINKEIVDIGENAYHLVENIFLNNMDPEALPDFKESNIQLARSSVVHNYLDIDEKGLEKIKNVKHKLDTCLPFQVSYYENKLMTLMNEVLGPVNFEIQMQVMGARLMSNDEELDESEKSRLSWNISDEDLSDVIGIAGVIFIFLAQSDNNYVKLQLKKMGELRNEQANILSKYVNAIPVEG